MKFFKYLIFTIFVFFTVNAYSKTVLQEYSSFGSFDSEISACAYLVSKSSSGSTYKIETSSPYNRCSVYNSSGNYQLGAWLITTKDECKAGSSNVYSGSVTIQNWKDNDEWLNLNDAMLAKFTGTTVCANSCVHKFDFLGSGEGDSTNGPVSFKGKYVSTAQTCTSPTQGPTDTLNGTKTPTSEGCKSGEAYCDKPTTGCPSGYTSGSFNGKQICVKNNPDPTKPNPNDPNNGNGNGGGKFDDSKIIAAINDSKTSITNSINNAVNSINSSISTINQSITAVANAVTGTTNAVNNNTNAVNAVKSSVDALHNTINAVTTAVNNNTNAVTSAVNANTSATNAVKASVDALNSTVSAVTSAVDNNTKAVNANGDKVANAVKDNITATNAVKTAVENLNSAVNAVTTAVNANGDKVSNSVSANGDKVANAVNANGDKVTDAVNKGTEATKENGKKLDGVKSSVDEGNSLLKDIKDWLTKEPELETGELEIKEEMLPGYERKDYVQFTNSCPFTSQQESLPMGVLGTITFTKDLTFICSYGADARPYIIGLGYLGALIYLLYGLRSRNG
ncbi:hypothetical protein ACG95N_03285 [Acinetobacter guillouiae]|uniref:hypothetical protein n=1 Tax=Acinetobacter guillouiae TaxID=106649 RepID=UPI003AF69D4F